MSLYFAYGSNLNVAQMARRCPAADLLGRFTLKNHRLVFRGVADVVPEDGAKVVGGVWRITKDCEARLHRFEGNGSAYRKEYVPVSGGLPGEDWMFFYAMNSEGIYPPSQRYLDGIREGYRDFGISVAQLNAAVRHAWENKNPSHLERQRYRRTGRPPLARPPGAKKTGMSTTGNQLALFEGDA